MEIWKLSKKIGIIAEDISDIEVVSEILAKYLNENDFTVKKFVGHGCGKLRNKCASWAKLLTKQGCSHILLFHDLDRHCETVLRNELEYKIRLQSVCDSIVVIPNEEMEAWLLSDPQAIKSVFSLKSKPKYIPDCEAIISPKEYLQKVVWALGRKKYLNTVHNKRIANLTSLNNLKRCRSFKVLDEYLQNL
jgi:hypothetical protein